MITKEEFKKWIFTSVRPEALFICAALFTVTGSALVVAELTWCAFPARFDDKPYASSGNLELGFWILAAAAILGLFVLKDLSKTEPHPADLRYNNIMFGRALVGIGFFLLLDALLNVIALSGFASHGTDQYIFRPNVPLSQLYPGITNAPAKAAKQAAADSEPSSSQTEDKAKKQDYSTSKEGNQPTAIDQLTPRQRHLITAIQLICALGFTLMGALFFFAKSLWEKMQSTPPVQYDHRIFWAGLWFRLGESIVFTIAVFVALLFQQHSDAAAWMPLIALVIGLSVKATENLIAGLCERILAAVNGLINR